MLSGGKGRRYCFSDAPRKPNTTPSLLIELKLDVQVQHSTQQHSPGSGICSLSGWSVWLFLSGAGHLSLSCKHCDILNEVFLAGKIRNEGLFGAGLKFDKASDSTLRKCELLQKSSCFIHLGNLNISILNTAFFVTGFGTQGLNSTYDPWKLTVVNLPFEPHLVLCGSTYHFK